MAKKKRKFDPDQGDLFRRKMTQEECRKRGGDSWKADSRLPRKAGKNMGWCHKKNGWIGEDGLNGGNGNA